MVDGVKVAQTGVPAARGAAREAEIVDAARQFEAVLIAQMLRSMRESGGSSGWLGTGEDSTSASAMEMAEEHFASALSAQGGLGLAKLVAQGLAKPAHDR